MEEGRGREGGILLLHGRTKPFLTSGARKVPKQKTARQWARRWQACCGVARKTLPAHEDSSQEAVQGLGFS